jgi:hypothetical protein
MVACACGVSVSNVAALWVTASCTRLHNNSPQHKNIGIISVGIEIPATPAEHRSTQHNLVIHLESVVPDD